MSHVLFFCLVHSGSVPVCTRCALAFRIFNVLNDISLQNYSYLCHRIEQIEVHRRTDPLCTLPITVDNMKKVITLVIAIMTMATVNGQTLTERQKGLAACACLMAQGDLERLEPAVKTALDNGVTINELKEAFSQLYAYTGFPRSLNALGVLSKVLESSPSFGGSGGGGRWQEGKPWTRPALWDDAAKALKQGTEVQTKLSGRAFNYDFCPQDDYYHKHAGFTSPEE